MDEIAPVECKDQKRTGLAFILKSTSQIELMAALVADIYGPVEDRSTRQTAVSGSSNKRLMICLEEMTPFPWIAK
jgi:hypothetical protein